MATKQENTFTTFTFHPASAACFFIRQREATEAQASQDWAHQKISHEIVGGNGSRFLVSSRVLHHLPSMESQRRHDWLHLCRPETLLPHATGPTSLLETTSPTLLGATVATKIKKKIFQEETNA